MFLILDYADTDLHTYISQKSEEIPIKVIKRIFYQILKGVEEIHKNNIIHRDIKPQNILVKDNRIIKLADFGLARGSGLPCKNISERVATLWYRPPDVILGNTNYSKSIDMWAVGCIMAQLFSENRIEIFRGKNEQDQLKQIYKVIGTPKLIDNPELETYLVPVNKL